MSSKTLSILVEALNAQKAANDIGKVDSAVARLGTSAGTGGGAFSRAMGVVSRASAGVGGALSHAAGQIKGLVTGPLGMLGLAGGALSLGTALTSSVGKIEAFGAGLEKVQMLTGETALASGALLIQFQKFGLGADDVTRIAGFAEKTLGKLNETMGKGKDASSKLAQLDKQFGLQLIDSSGKVVDFSTTLNQLANYYDSNASASQKAYLASQIFGRGYTEMLPILNEGSAGLRQAANDAAALGLGSADTVKQLSAFHDQMHALENQTNLLQLSIGAALLPTLIDLSTAATKFVSDHRSDIVTFFKNAVAVGKQVGGVILSIGQSFLNAWNMIPPGFRDLLVKGFVADRTFKFLFGFDPIKAALGGIDTVLATAVQKALGISVGKTLGNGIAQSLLGGVQKVWVVNPGFGGGGGPTLPPGTPSPEPGGGGILNVVKNVVKYLPPVLLTAGTLDLAANVAGVNSPNRQIMGPDGQPQKNRFGGTTFRTANNGRPLGVDAAASPISVGMPVGLHASQDVMPIADALKLAAPNIVGPIVGALDRWGMSADQWASTEAQAYKAGGSSLINTLGRERNKLDAIAIATVETDRFLNGTAGPFYRDGKNQTRLLASLEADQKYFNAHGDTATAASLGHDIDLLKQKIAEQKPPSVTVNVSTQVSIRDQQRLTYRVASYGKLAPIIS